MIQRLRSFAIILLTATLLYLVFRKVGVANLLEVLQNADLLWVLLSLFFAPILVLVSVIKWNLLLEAQGSSVPLWRLFSLYLVGRFFNNFLPSNFGGDVVRAYELGNYTRQGTDAVASVFMERLTGFIILIGMALVSFVTHLTLMKDFRLTLAMGLAVVILLVVLWLILDPRPLNLFERWMNFSLARRYIPKLRKFHTSLLAYRDRKGVLAKAFFWSFVFMSLAILNVYTTARAFHNPIPFWDLFFVVPIILVVAMLPLTFNGLGLQEWAYVLLFPLIGLPASVGLSTILFIRAKDLLLALIGGLLYPVIKLTPRPELSGNEGSE